MGTYFCLQTGKVYGNLRNYKFNPVLRDISEKRVLAYGGKFMKSLRYKVFMPLAAGAMVSASLYVATTRVEAAEDAKAEATSAASVVEHAECEFFGPKRDHFMQSGLNKARAGRGESQLEALTREVMSRIPDFLPGGSHNHDVSQGSSQDTIDSYVLSLIHI